MFHRVDAPDFPSEHHWPVVVRRGSVWLTPFRPRLVDEVSRLRARNAGWLRPWDATAPPGTETYLSASARVANTWASARNGFALPWLVRWGDSARATIIGQCTVSNITYGSVRTSTIGYWIDQGYAGRSITPGAVALATDYVLRTLGLHRVEICVRPENAASLRVPTKLGFRHEGQRRAYIHIAGDWRDHEVFAITAEESTELMSSRLPEWVYSGQITMESHRITG